MAYAGEGELGMKTAAQMTVEEFTAWLKQRKAQMLEVTPRLANGGTAQQRMPRLTPLMAMHTRRAMQRRREK